MVYSEERYEELEEALHTKSREFVNVHENDKLARTLHITTNELMRIHGEVKQKYREEAGRRHVCQDTFFVKGLHSVYALHRLVKHHRYDAANREVRYLFETFFLLRGLNGDKDEAENIYREYLEELQELGDVDKMEQALHDFHATDRLFGVWRREYDACEEVWPEVKQFYNYFSNRSSHPVRMIGAALDGNWSEGEEKQLLTLGLYMQYGLTRELLKTFNDTSAEPFIKEESQPIVKRFDQVLGKDIPTFLLDMY
ncbi:MULTISPECIES: hypothetical protein [Haloferacaceae]|uniref:Uncharacterized protein n=1 Tax=Halorubrum glutamatedens TaxID=2707018 RepID=A0ABD5QWY3_9EURY|nr:hypothetical protein [Halobellus captivus]